MSDSRGRRRAAVAVAVVVVLAAFGFLLWGRLGENVVFFLTPEELLARGEQAYDAPVRLGGQVAPGSVRWDAARLDLRFQLVDGKGKVDVRSKGTPPQMFRDGMGVVVEGRYRRGGDGDGDGGVFESTNLIVKHSNEYRAPKPGERPQEMYRSLLREAKP